MELLVSSTSLARMVQLPGVDKKPGLAWYQRPNPQISNPDGRTFAKLNLPGERTITCASHQDTPADGCAKAPRYSSVAEVLTNVVIARRVKNGNSFKSERQRELRA